MVLSTHRQTRFFKWRRILQKYRYLTENLALRPVIQHYDQLSGVTVVSSVIHPMGEIKIENFHRFDIHWLYRMSSYAVIKVAVTEHNDVTKRHGIVITIWRTSAIEVTALSKTQEKESVMSVRDRQKNPSL